MSTSNHYIFDIKRYSIHDGPGVRMTVFFKGCPLRCIWCHNPEGLSQERQMMYTAKRCIGCGECLEGCRKKALHLGAHGIERDTTRCIVCGSCSDRCPTKALEISGGSLSIDEIMCEVDKQLFIIGKGGGISFCGGEPLAHTSLLIPLLIKCKSKNIHTLVDTSFHIPEHTIKEVMPLTDLFFVDIKHMDSAKHALYTGVPNNLILHNIRMVADSGKDFYIRIPLIEGINADEKNISETARFLSSLPWQTNHVDLLPYHEIGKSKAEKLGMKYNPDNFEMSTPTPQTIDRCISIFRSYGINTYC